LLINHPIIGHLFMSPFPAMADSPITGLSEMAEHMSVHSGDASAGSTAKFESDTGGTPEETTVEEVAEEPFISAPPAARRVRPGDDFEVFDASFRVRGYLPIIVFTDDVGEQQVWHDGRVADGCVQLPSSSPDMRAVDPVVMSPAYLGFTVEPYEERYLHYRGVGMVFSRPFRAKFMQPSIDTMLLCYGLALLFEKCEGTDFRRIIDIGAGSGFIGKFAAVHAPGAREAHLVDIDQAAKEYWESPGFGTERRTVSGHELTWQFHAGDAVELLAKDAAFDLIISNPPYIPTLAEASRLDGASHKGNFWEGCGLLIYLMELIMEDRVPRGARVVVALTSLTLKSRRVRALLEEAPSKGVQVRVHLEREIAWKAWYAGTGSGPSYLLADDEEFRERQKIGDCEFFVGCRPPGESRTGGARDRLWGYHWHVAYVVELHRPV